MLSNTRNAFALALIALTSACSATHSPCGAEGRYLTLDEADYCVYGTRQPIVIEGGFSCPAPMMFKLDRGGHFVCSDHPLDPERLPRGLCLAMPGVCSEQGPPANRPPEPSADSAAEPSLPAVDAGSGPTDGEPSPDYVWRSCYPGPGGAVDRAQTGDRCQEFSECGRSNGCDASFVTCAPGGIVQASDLQVLECPVAPPPKTEAPIWRGAEDCEAALRDGRSFQRCEGSFACAKRTEEPCCIEYALCNDSGPLPANSLVRYRFCERGCEALEPDTSLPTVQDCSYFEVGKETLAREFSRADLPCTGNFICWDHHDLSSGAGLVVQERLDEGVLRWCADGIVRGQHSTLSYAFIPAH